MSRATRSPKKTSTRQVAKYLPRTTFGRQLREGVDDYFEKSGQPRRDVPRAYLKAFIILAWLFGSYLLVLLVASTPTQAVIGGISIGLAMAGVGFNLQHDGGHGAFSRRPWVNKLMALALDLLGASSYFWHFKHNIAHHSHPNVVGQDDDISHGVLLRISPLQKWYPHHRFQVVYAWILYSVFAIEWQLISEFRNYFSKRWVGSTFVPVPRRADLILFWLTRVLFLGLAFILPFCLHPVAHVLAIYAISAVTLSLVMALVFQLAHCSDMTAFRTISSENPLIPRPWDEHQVETTVDFAPGNRPLTWYLGGLNFQIEHHLFPRVCHVNYPALAPIVAATCRAHGVRYVVHPTMFAALRSHARLLREMGRRPASESVPLESPLPYPSRPRTDGCA